MKVRLVGLMFSLFAIPMIVNSLGLWGVFIGALIQFSPVSASSFERMVATMLGGTYGVLALALSLPAALATYSSVRYLRNRPFEQHASLGVVLAVVGLLFFLLDKRFVQEGWKLMPVGYAFGAYLLFQGITIIGDFFPEAYQVGIEASTEKTSTLKLVFAIGAGVVIIPLAIYVSPRSRLDQRLLFTAGTANISTFNELKQLDVESRRKLVPRLVANLANHDAFGPGWSAHSSARRALLMIGLPAVPDLVHAIKYRDESPDYFTGVLEDMDPTGIEEAIRLLANSLQDKETRIRYRVTRALGKLGSTARGAEPYLLQVLSDSNIDIKIEAAKALVKLDSFVATRGVEILIKIIEDGGQPRPSIQAIRALEDCGGLAGAAVPTLKRTLKDNNPSIRLATIRALGAMGPVAKEAVPILIETLKDSDRGAQVDASRALAKIGSMAVHELIKALKDKDTRVQGGAIYALERMGAAAKAAVPELSRLLDSPDHRLRRGLIQALAAIGTPVDKAVPAIVRTVNEGIRIGENEVQRRSAVIDGIRAIRRIGYRTVEGIHFLSRTLKHESSDVREEAAIALADVGPSAKDAVTALVEALKDPHEKVRDKAAEGLGNIGPQASGAIPALIEVIRNGPATLPFRAADALGKMGPKAQQRGVESFTQDLANPNIRTRVGAAYALTILDPGTKGIVPILRQALKVRDFAMRYNAMAGLQRIASSAQAVIPDLVDALTDEDERIRIRATTTLVSIAPFSSDAPKMLISVLRDENQYGAVRAEAARALGTLTPATEEVVSTLRWALGSDDKQISGEATKALERFTRQEVREAAGHHRQKYKHTTRPSSSP